MKTHVLLLAAAAALPAVAAPAVAQTYQEQQRWDAAQRRYDNETRMFQQARDQFMAACARDHRRRDCNARMGGDPRYGGGPDGRYADAPPPPPPGGYDAPPPPGGYDAPPPPPPGYAGGNGSNYDAYRDYREEPGYERRLSTNDQVYRGSDGRYYCKRTDGTTGLVIGGASGALLGNVIDGGHNRVAGTLIGGALGALIGKSAEQSNNDYRCR